MKEEFRVNSADAFGAGIRWFRKNDGVSQAQLAEDAQIYVPRLSDLERGLVTKQLERLVRVFRCLGVEIVLRKIE